ncbi:hypothetical protein GCM10027160_29130 [Streptomyces calidiresistens]
MVGGLAATLHSVYATLVAIAEMLPIGVGLPLERHAIHVPTATQAVRRLAEISGRVTMAQDDTNALYGACVDWLAAADLLELLREELQESGRITPTRYDGCASLLIRAQRRSMLLWSRLN